MVDDNGGGDLGHAHSHGAPSSAHLNLRGDIARWLAIAVGVVIAATLIGAVVYRPTGSHRRHRIDAFGSAPIFANGTVTSSDEISCGEVTANDSSCISALVEVTSGNDKGEPVVLEMPSGAGSPVVHAGDHIVLAKGGGVDRSDPSLGYAFADFQRQRPLALLLIVFALVVVVLGRWSGGRALIGLAISGAIVTGFIVPAILDGRSPVGVAIVGSTALMLVAIYLVHGFSQQTSVAVLGTGASLALTGVLSVGFVGAAHLTGLASEEASYLQLTAGQVNIKGLILAGIIIGTLGVLGDMTITQVSAVWELKAAAPDITTAALYRRAVRIGRDHISSTVNTLVFAYAGASLPLLILFAETGQRVHDVVTSEVVATEIIRTLVGGIGLVASVPLTTALAALVVSNRPHSFTSRSPNQD